MTDIEEFYRNQALIDSIKSTLINYGYEYHNSHGWYNENDRMLDEEKKRIAKIGIEKMNEAIKRNDELKEKLGITC